MSRGRYIAAAAIVIAVAAVLFWQFGPRPDRATKATTADALEGFRESGGGAGGRRGPLFEREPGVYEYRTRGSETADAGLLSATHDYDGISTITIKPKGCGVVERWQVLAGRWAEFTSCPAKGGRGGGFFELVGLVEFHEFFGEGREDEYTCSGDAASTRSSRTPGTRFQGRCESGDGENTVVSHSLVEGIEKVTVGGRRYDAVHTSTDVRLRGATEGTAERDDWRRRSDGLLLKRVSRNDVDLSGAIGGTYEESYTIELLSVEPKT